MAKHTLIDTDETQDGLAILFYTQSGKVFEENISDIIAWIDETEINTHTSGYGLSSDPYSRDEVITVDANEYYAENYNEVNEAYFKQVLNKH